MAEGATVYVTDLNDSLGEAVAASLGEHAAYTHLDVREEAHWRAITTRILAERGALHVVVNNAGITGFEEGIVPHDPEHASLADWHQVHRTNLDGVFLGCKCAPGRRQAVDPVSRQWQLVCQSSPQAFRPLSR